MALNPEGQVSSQGYEQLERVSQSLKLRIESFEIPKTDVIDSIRGRR